MPLPIKFHTLSQTEKCLVLASNDANLRQFFYSDMPAGRLMVSDMLATNCI